TPYALRLSSRSTPYALRLTNTPHPAPAPPHEHAALRTHPASRRAVRASKREFPYLRDKLRPEAPMLLLAHELEARLTIDATRRHYLTLRPEHQFAIAGRPRELHAFAHESFAQAKSACGRLDIQQPQFGDGLRFRHQEYRSQDLSIPIGNPTPLAS